MENNPKNKKIAARDKVDSSLWETIRKTACCEACDHFIEDTNSCLLGYLVDPHLSAKQKQDYEKYGAISFCRHIEVRLQ
jgi:hypothetical protein